MATKVIMPQLGESVIEGTIAAWLKEEGEEIELYEPILEIETDKVTTESTAEVAGTLLKILVPIGETVEVGTVLAIIGQPGEDIGEENIGEDEATLPPPIESETPPPQKEPVAAEKSTAIPTTAPLVLPQPGTNGPGRVKTGTYSGRVSPVVGRIAGEHNVDLNDVRGTGRDGRITKKDILKYIEQRDSGQITTPQITAPQTQSPPGPQPGDLLPLTGIRKAIAEHMVRSKETSPHVTTVFDLDFSAVMANRQANKADFARDGANLTLTAYIMAAIVRSLKAHPLVNSRWRDDGIYILKEINIGMATAIPDGLIVPIIKNADGLSLLGLARAVNDLADRARKNGLKPDEVQGGTFTLTNHGVSGSLFATPIINQPQCAILGMGKIEKRVKVINDALAIRPMAYASLTFDHRILDGASADGFMTTFKNTLENWS